MKGSEKVGIAIVVTIYLWLTYYVFWYKITPENVESVWDLFSLAFWGVGSFVLLIFMLVVSVEIITTKVIPFLDKHL